MWLSYLIRSLTGFPGLIQAKLEKAGHLPFASSCQAPQWDPQQACLFDFCKINEEHVLMWSEGRQRDRAYLQAKFLYCSCLWLL